MNSKLIPVIAIAATLLGGSAYAVDATPVAGDSSALASAPPADHVVYLAQLPAPGDLIKGANAQGTTILRMDQTADHIIVVYQYSGGRTVTFAYTLLSSAGANVSVAPQPAVSAPVVVAQPAPPPTVVYTSPAPVYYEPTYVRTYDPAWDFWAPLAIGVGLGWGWGHGWHGGGWHHSGGWHSGGWHH